MRYFLFFLLIIHSAVFAQVSIRGKVLNNSSGEPVYGASVYINNSTIGVSTNELGEYHLSHILPGTYEIIISHIAYEPLVYRIEIKSNDQKIVFRLESRVKLMRNILVMTKDQRKAKMKIFREQFLGITNAAEKTLITNEEDVLFEADEKTTAFKAFSEVPLVIVNKEMGYRVYYELQEFYVDQRTGKVYFFGYARYEDLEKGNLEKWKKKREKYYWGSTMHLFHSLNRGNAEEQGFSFYTIRNMENSGPGFGVKAMVRTYSDSLVFLDSGLQKKYLKWNGDIVVKYNSDPYYKRDLTNKVMLSGANTKGIETTITMLEAPAYLAANGIPENPLAIQYSGFWSYERLATMLPLDFRPSRRLVLNE